MDTITRLLLILYRAYCTVWNHFSWLRGTTRLKVILAETVLKHQLERVDGGYLLEYDGVDIIMEEPIHFEEILLESDPVDGYTRKRDIGEDDTVLDAGAYPGEFTIYAARKGNDVIALEAGDNIEPLRRNLELNDLDNVEIVEKALWEEEGEVVFQMKGLASQIDQQGGMTVPTTTLDLLYSDHGDIDFIKMDIEGAEIQALQAAEQLMEEHDPFFAIASYHIVGGEATASQLETLFQQRGYAAATGYPGHQTTWGWKEE